MYFPPYQQLLRVTKNEPDGEHALEEVTISINFFKFLLQAALGSADFDEESYLAANPEVRDHIAHTGNITPNQHFVGYGYFEGRKGALPKVDEKWYLETYTDVAAVVPNIDIKSATEHFEVVGAAEGRAPSLEHLDVAQEWKKLLNPFHPSFKTEVISVPFEGILQWNDGTERAVAQIAQNHRPLKILLKTKDDPEMLRDWIEHHKQIVGFGGLILMDNMSSDPKVSEIYADLKGLALVIRFSGFLDNVHHTDHVSELYRALRLSCSHFIFLDTDERLTLFNGKDHFHADSSILTFLEHHPDTSVFPGTWLANIVGYKDRFSLETRDILLAHGLKWGKPVISSSCNFNGFINHNSQMDHSLYSGPLITNFFVLHLSRVSNQQRIDSNLRKLRAAGVISNDCGVEELLQQDPQKWDDLSDELKSYVQEIVHIHEAGLGFVGNVVGSIQIRKDGRVIFGEDWQRQAMLDLLSGSPQFVSALSSA